MRVHNIFGDLLLGLSKYINEKVLHGKPVKHFQYNIGDSSFQLDYEKGYSLPAAIVNLENVSPYNNKPYIFQHRSGNIHRIPVVYDHDKDLLLFVQEEQFTINVSFNINCTNHVQALDLRHQLHSVIPVNKYMHFYSFMTFLEMDDFLINPHLFDVTNDKIDNLFLKQNKFLETFSYCFGLDVQPLLRFNDFTVNMSPDTNLSTFQVSTNVEYLMTVPVYLIYPKFDISSNIGLPTVTVKRENIEVPVGNYDYIDLTFTSVEPNDKFFTTITEPILRDDLNFSQNIIFLGKSQELVDGLFKGFLKGETLTCNVETIQDGQLYSAVVNIFHDFTTNEIYGDITGYSISGKITNVVFNPDGKTILCWFSGLLNEVFMEKEILLQYSDLKKNLSVTNIQVILNNTQYILINTQQIFNNSNIYNSVDITDNKTNIDQSTTISNISFLDNTTNEKTNIEFIPSLTLTENGFFEGDFTLGGNPKTVTGYVDFKDGSITPFFNDTNYVINSVLFDVINFTFIPGTGSNSYIERFHIDLNWNEGIITDIMDIDIRMFNKYTKTLVIHKLRNITELPNRDYRFSISVPPWILSDVTKIIWKIIFSNKQVLDGERSSDLSINLSLSTISNLVFDVKRNFYFSNFFEISKTNPIFLSIGTKK